MYNNQCFGSVRPGTNHKVAWYENLDGQGNFGPQQIITTQTDSVLYLFAIDLDLDSDIDVLSASIGDGKICWFENKDGKGDFSDAIVITQQAAGATSVHAADIDGDGDIDVLSASEYDHKVAWYKNLLIETAVQTGNNRYPLNFTLEQNYPNPFNPATTIKYNLKKSCYVCLKIYNLSGQEVEKLFNKFQIKGEHEITWQPKGLPSGIYLYRLQAGDFSETKKLIMQK
ncbi:T9SS type A sorting domain-containing protein [candidate division KSB1 bacterium]|nr:T9SS type A sorting domain-containing protein [candidate division KSB1 bacterium]